MSQLKERQRLLFSEPNYSETGVWCTLNPCIDPAEWASLCRFLGKMCPDDFKKVKNRVVGSPDPLGSRFKRMFDFSHINMVEVPILSLGPSGIGGEFQKCIGSA